MSSVEISVNIPTLNSSQTLKKCLESVMDHADNSIEVVIIDCGSSDNTLEIAEKFDCRIVVDASLRTLGQRRKAVEVSSGKYCLVMDSDQVLGNDVLRTLYSKYTRFDMVILGERSLNPKCTLAKLADADRILAQQDIGKQKDPSRGMLIPRFYRRDLLLRAFDFLNRNFDSMPSGWEDAVIYSKASLLSENIGYLPNSIFHQDRCSPSGFFTHYFEFGKSAKDIFLKDQELKKLVNSKLAGRMLMSRRDLDFKLRFLSTIYMIIKGSSYMLGIWAG